MFCRAYFIRHQQSFALCIFVYKLYCSKTEDEDRNLIFEILTESKRLKRFDLFDDFWKKFDVYDPPLKTQVGLEEIESINNANVITSAVNPKDYFEKIKDKIINKKHKGMRKDAPGMTFESFAGRIMSIREYDDTNVRLPKK